MFSVSTNSLKHPHEKGHSWGAQACRCGTPAVNSSSSHDSGGFSEGWSAPLMLIKCANRFSTPHTPVHGYCPGCKHNSSSADRSHWDLQPQLLNPTLRAHFTDTSEYEEPFQRDTGKITHPHTYRESGWCTFEGREQVPSNSPRSQELVFRASAL